MRAPADEPGITIEPLGETRLLLRFGGRIDAGLNAQVHAAAAILGAAGLAGVGDLVPSYASLALAYDPAAWATGDRPPWQRLAAAARAALAASRPGAAPPRHSIVVPVRYGGAHGADAGAVAARCGLTLDELVACHAAADYRVAMLGFAPGFAYLLGLDPRLHAPRRAEPRVRVPAGSVAIGGAQTGIYPSELPGGWQLIGRTPLRLFDPARTPPCPLAAGDRVRFRPIGDDEFADLAARAQ